VGTGRHRRELPPDSSLEDVRRAYKDLMRRYHPDKHAEDTLRTGCGLCDEALVREVAAAAPAAVRQLAAQGARFDRAGDGDAFSLGREGGHGAARILHVGDGTGAFWRQDASPISQDAGGSRDVVLSDLDGDGDLDVVIVNSTHEDNFAYVNQGHGQGGVQGAFERLALDPLVSDGGTSYGVTAADLDGDGLPEIVVSNRHSVNFLYRNTSAGGAVSFERVLDGVFSSALGDSFASAVGDLDGDGDRDVVVANRETPTDLFLGAGAPFTFERAPAGALVEAAAESLDVELADLDGDGFPELALANESQQTDLVLDNLGPMWADLGAALPGSQGPPRLEGIGQLEGGAEVRVRVEQLDPGAPTQFVLGLGQIFAPFAGGVLVPSPDIVAPAVPADTEGVLELDFDYPAGLPAGFQFTLQALAADRAAVAGLAFSNGLQATGL